MYLAETLTRKRSIPETAFKFKRFRLQDQALLQAYVEQFSPQSCEYNFANLFAWQDVYDISWTLYQGRLLIYDGLSKIAFMPLGEDFFPEDLVVLSLNLAREGLTPNFGLVTRDYMEKYPDLAEYYTVEEQREAAEYIYDVNKLVELSGTKLNKKKNLISQFKRYYPEYDINVMAKADYPEILEFSSQLMNGRAKRSKTLEQEFEAIKTSFQYFDALHLEGLVIRVKGRIVAFAVFSRISQSTFDIQFEKADPQFKGAGQLVNNETARFLKDRCRFVNREQDLGIKGLRQAKLSYEPVELMASYGLIFNPPN